MVYPIPPEDNLPQKFPKIPLDRRAYAFLIDFASIYLVFKLLCERYTCTAILPFSPDLVVFAGVIGSAESGSEFRPLGLGYEDHRSTTSAFTRNFGVKQKRGDRWWGGSFNDARVKYFFWQSFKFDFTIFAPFRRLWYGDRR